MVLSPSPGASVRSCSTVESNRKKRTVVVVRRHDRTNHPSPKKRTLLVSRRPRPSEGCLFDGQTQAFPNREGALIREQCAVGELSWHPDGRVVERSILGTAGAFEEVDARLGLAQGRPEHDEDSPEQDKAPTTPLTGSRQSSRPRTAPDDLLGPHVDASARRYIRHVLEARERASKHRAKTRAKGTKLIARLGLTEMLTARREANALRQWERRQRDWLRVKERMAAETGKAPQALLMCTAEDFRERSEEYRLLQNATPAHEKYGGENYWMMSLRGYNERVCNIGNVFSGLSCILDNKPSPVHTVRKPAGAITDTTRRRTWRDSKALDLRKKALAPALRRLRPHELQPEDTRGLLVEGRDLLEWAVSSSTEYFRLRHAQKPETELVDLERTDEVCGRKLTDSKDDGEVSPGELSQREATCSGRGAGPALEIISPEFLLIEASAGQNHVARATVTVRNAGSTVLFLTWSRVPRPEAVTAGTDQSTGGVRNGNGRQHKSAVSTLVSPGEKGGAPGGSAAKGPAASRGVAQEPDARFFCHQTSETLLPGEEYTTCFSFKSADPGIFSDRWRVTTIPQASLVRSPPLSSRSSPPDPGRQFFNALLPASHSGSKENGQSSGARGRGPRSNQESGDQEDRSNVFDPVAPMGWEAMGEVALRAVAVAPDTREHARLRLSNGLQRGIVAAQVEELVRDVIGGVRTPVREEELRNRSIYRNSSLPLHDPLHVAHLSSTFELVVRCNSELLDGSIHLVYDHKAEHPRQKVRALSPVVTRKTHQIRRRQREEFLVANSGRGLYFSSWIYDAFAALLQRAKAIALKAQGGKYGPIAASLVKEPAFSEQGQGTESVGDETIEPGALEGEKGGEDLVTNSSALPESSTGSPATPTTPPASSTAPQASTSTAQTFSYVEEELTRTLEEESVEESCGSGALEGGTDSLGVEVDPQQELLQSVPTIRSADVDHTSGERDSRGLDKPLVTAKGDDQATETQPWDTETSIPFARSDRELGLERLKGMLRSLDCREWNGAVDAVLDAIDGLNQWIPPPEHPRLSGGETGEVTGGTDWNGRVGAERMAVVDEGRSVKGLKGKSGGLDSDDDEASDLGDDECNGTDKGEGSDGVCEEGKEVDGEEDGEEEEEDGEKYEEEEGEEGEEEEIGYHPVIREQKKLAKEWRRLVFESSLEPELDARSFMREELIAMVEAVADAMEHALEEASDLLGEGQQLPTSDSVLGYDEDSMARWAVVCPPSMVIKEIESEVRARAMEAANAGQAQAAALILAYAGVGREIRTAVERFETRLSAEEAAQRDLAAVRRHEMVLAGPISDQRRGIPALSRLAVLSKTDIEGRCLLLHADLAERRQRGFWGKRGAGGSTNTDDGRLFPEEIQMVAEQVRGMLSAKPKAVAIISEVSPCQDASPWQARVKQWPYSEPAGFSQPPQNPVSLHATAEAVSSLLGIEVEFYESVPAAATALRECLDGGNSLGPRVMMVECLSAPGVVPAPPQSEPECSDSEDERLPDFILDGEIGAPGVAGKIDDEKEKALFRAAEQGSLGEMLSGAIDVTVLDAPRRLYEPRRELPWGPEPTTGFTVAGTGLHGDLTGLAYLTEASDRPLLAIVGGERLEPRLKLIDGLLDIVDILAIGGGLSMTLLAAAHAGPEGCGAGRKRPRKWGKSSVGLPRDPLDVLVPARRLLVKARKKGVELILPSDFVVGDIEVDEWGPLPRWQSTEEGADEPRGGPLEEGGSEGTSDTGGDDNGSDNRPGGEMAYGGPGTTSGPSGAEANVALGPGEQDDSETGYEYEGETMDVSLEDGIPRGFIPMDIGPRTTEAFKGAIRRARAILWHGMLGVAECIAFQSGTREVLEAVTAAYESDEAREAGTSPVVILCGRSLGECAGRLVEAEDDAPPLGAGWGVSHVREVPVCVDPELYTRVLEGRFIPGLEQLSERDPAPVDADLGKVLRRRFFGEDEGEDDDREDEESEDP